MKDVDARRRSRGQGVAEFALVIPLFLVMLFGIIDLGRVIWANDALANAAREGARYASVTGSSLINTDRQHEGPDQGLHEGLRHRRGRQRHGHGVLLGSDDRLEHGRLQR